MKDKKKTLLIVTVMAASAIIGTAIFLSLSSQSNSKNADGSGSTSPLGALFFKAASVSRLKEQMGNLREVHAAMMQYAEAHEDELPKTIAQLKPYLPKKLATLDDKDWELPATGKMKPLMNGPAANNAVLLQQKNVASNKPRIILYADGHIEYKQ